MPFSLSEQIVDVLLEKLSSDDDFRAQFLSNPREALAAVGHQAAAQASDGDQGLWVCLQCTQLASKEAIAASREDLRRQLLSAQAVYFPVGLEISPSPS